MSRLTAFLDKRMPGWRSPTMPRWRPPNKPAAHANLPSLATSKYLGFKGDWHHRLDHVFDAGVDFKDKSILDAGCNIGVVAYEIAKRAPAFIHGVDYHPPFVDVADTIFQGYTGIGRQFDVVNLCDIDEIKSKLHPSYDVVLLLSIWQHILGQVGPETAERIAIELLNRCQSTLLARNGRSTAPLFADIIKRAGFEIYYEYMDIDGAQLIACVRKHTRL